MFFSFNFQLRLKEIKANGDTERLGFKRWLLCRYSVDETFAVVIGELSTSIRCPKIQLAFGIPRRRCLATRRIFMAPLLKWHLRWPVSARAVIWLDNKNWKPLEWFSEDWPLTSLVSPILLACRVVVVCLIILLVSLVKTVHFFMAFLYGSSSSVLQMFLLFSSLLVFNVFSFYLPSVSLPLLVAFMLHFDAKSHQNISE